MWLSMVVKPVLLLSSLKNIFVFYFFWNVRRYLPQKYKEISIYLSIAVTLFVIELLNGILSEIVLIGTIFTVPLIIVNFSYFISYTLWGCVIKLYK